MTPDHARTPLEYAANIARYIGDPSTIRARTLDFFGRAPSVDQCANLRQAALDRVEQFRRECEARATELADRQLIHGDIFPCGHERSLENTFHIGNREECRQCADERRAQIVRRLKVASHRVTYMAPIEFNEPRPEDAIPADALPSRKVVLLAAALTGLRVEQIMATNRQRHIVRVRWAIMVALKSIGTMSTTQIGNIVGLTDHTTVLYALRQAEHLIKRDAEFAALIDRLKRFARSGLPKVCGDLVNTMTQVAA